MSVLDTINNILSTTPNHLIDPSDFLVRCTKIFDEACTIGGEFDPREESKSVNACNAYGGISKWFLDNELTFAAESLLIDAWNKFEQIQFNEKRRIYKAGIAMYLARVYHQLNDKGAAIRWALYTQADDMLGEHPTGGGAGRQMLLTILRMGNEALTIFNGIAAENVNNVKTKYASDWSSVPGFPEDVVRRFALEYREFGHLFGVETSLPELPLSNAYFSALLADVHSTHTNTTNKGNSLENLASYLFLLIPGWVPRRNLLDERLAYETDLVISNLNPAGNLTAELLGRHFIIECKNKEKTIGVPDVGYFLYRMRLTHAKFGIIFAKNDVSGRNMDDRDEWAAYQLIRKAFHEDGNICIVISDADLDDLREGTIKLWPLLLGKIERLRFGVPKHS